jgi:hypothetical protein
MCTQKGRDGGLINSNRKNKDFLKDHHMVKSLTYGFLRKFSVNKIGLPENIEARGKVNSPNQYRK